MTTLATEQKASAILAGTYSVTPYTIIVNLRMLRVESNEVSSVAGVEIPRSKAIDQLLTLPGILEEPSLSAYERMGG